MLDTWRPRFKGKRNNKRGEGRGLRERRVTTERIEKEKGSFVKRGEQKIEEKGRRTRFRNRENYWAREQRVWVDKGGG